MNSKAKIFFVGRMFRDHSIFLSKIKDNDFTFCSNIKDAFRSTASDFNDPNTIFEEGTI